MHLSPLCTKLSKSYCNSCTEISTKALVCKRDSFMKTKKAKNCFQTASFNILIFSATRGQTSALIGGGVNIHIFVFYS